MPPTSWLLMKRFKYFGISAAGTPVSRNLFIPILESFCPSSFAAYILSYTEVRDAVGYSCQPQYRVIRAKLLERIILSPGIESQHSVWPDEYF